MSQKIVGALASKRIPTTLAVIHGSENYLIALIQIVASLMTHYARKMHQIQPLITIPLAQGAPDRLNATMSHPVGQANRSPVRRSAGGSSSPRCFN
jgi:hypothetical protein